MQSATTPLYGMPSESQAYRIQDIVMKREAELAQIDGDIIQVRALLQRLLQDRKDIRESLEAHKALIVPPPIPALQRIPPEIWAQIFAVSVKDAWAPGYPQINVQQPPLLLGHVCSTWRAISLSTPHLWSSICIPRRIRATAIPLIETWLKRSGAMPLSIEMNGLSSDFPSNVLDVFIPHSARWKNVSLFMSNAALAALFAKITLTSLDTIMLRLSGRPQQISLATSAKCLRSVTLVISRGIRPDPQILDLPWSQLTHLNIISISGVIDDGYDILNHCSALTHCSLSAVGSVWEATERPPCCLPSLSVLQLATNLDPGPLLDSLVLPHLVHLEIDFIALSYRPNVWPKAQIVSLVTRSSCRLQTLILRNKRIYEADLIECCRSIPTLHHLLVNGPEKCHGGTLELSRVISAQRTGS
jgi:hypothetical protein